MIKVNFLSNQGVVGHLFIFFFSSLKWSNTSTLKTHNHRLKLRENKPCVFSYFSTVLSVEFPNTVNGSAVHYPPIAMLCPGDPELQAPSPGAHSFRGKICRYLNSQLQCCVLSVLREGQTRCCGEVDLGD